MARVEMLVGEAFRLRGYRVNEQGGAGPDGGVDLVLAKGNEKFLVQCKQWRAFRVGVEVVRELYDRLVPFDRDWFRVVSRRSARAFFLGPGPR